MTKLKGGYALPGRATSTPAKPSRGPKYAAQEPCARLLNDNSQLRGPWFDSLGWLGEVWVPQAARLGLRYVAHVVQADQQTDTITDHYPLSLPFELQIFQALPEAREWLRSCR